jgi:hypothetical protein
MAQPTNLPEWADAAGAAVQTPPSTTCQLGFVAGERPPPQYLNWLFYWIYQWILWISGYPRASLWTWQLAVPENVTTGPLLTSASPTGTQDTSDAGYMMPANGLGTNGGGNLRVRIYPKFGDTIAAIGADGTLFFGTSSLALKYTDPVAGANVTVATSGAILGTPGTYALPTAHVVVDGASYWLDFFAGPSGGFYSGATIYALGYQAGNP